ncbi:MAG: hypothetical protein ACRCZF_28340 [Gemmataceae bacterium]
MATPTETVIHPPHMVQATTRRGMAAASFCLGLWSLLVFWWYPYSIFVATAGMILGSIAVVKNWRGGKDGENLAIVGCVLCSITIGTALTVYRVMQVYFGDLSTPIAP